MVEAAIGQRLPSYIERPADATGVFAIYPGNGVPPGSETWTWHEHSMQVPMFDSSPPTHVVRNVVIPTVTMFTPDPAARNGTSLLVAPGGGFRFLTMDREGYDMARWLTHLGVTAFVLRYRVAHTPENDTDMLGLLQKQTNVLPHHDRSAEMPPVGDELVEAARTRAEEDGRQAIRFIRRHATEWGLDSNRIGIAGFSAGGGVVMGAVMQHDAQSKPDFAAAIYPAFRTATPVPADAPPLFLATADDDPLVAPISTARLYEAWHKAGKPVELHIFATGNHGFGMKKQEHTSDQWIELFRHWLAVQGYVSPART